MVSEFSRRTLDRQVRIRGQLKVRAGGRRGGLDQSQEGCEKGVMERARGNESACFFYRRFISCT